MREVLRYQLIIVILLIVLIGVLFYMNSQILVFNDIVCHNCVRSYIENQTYGWIV